MINITLSKDVIILLKKEGFNTDSLLTQYFILYCLYTENTEPLTFFEDENKANRLVLHYYDLIRKGLISDKNNMYSLTEKGQNFMATVINMFEEPKKVLIVKNESVEDWFDEWIDLWPKGIKTGGKLIRSDKKDCFEKMKKFIKKYKHSSDIILKATQNYLDEFEKQNYQFIKSATYFIDKRGEGSELAARCQDLIDNPEDNLVLNNYVNTGLI